MSKPKIGIIIGSTRDTRFGEKPAKWMLDLASRREEIETELIDLRDYYLPMFNEAASNAWQESQDPRVLKWQQKIGEMDGFIFVTAEYNRSIPGALKNALDQAYVEWNYKPAAILGYGAVGGARAVESICAASPSSSTWFRCAPRCISAARSFSPSGTAAATSRSLPSKARSGRTRRSCSIS